MDKMLEIDKDCNSYILHLLAGLQAPNAGQNAQFYIERLKLIFVPWLPISVTYDSLSSVCIKRSYHRNIHRSLYQARVVARLRQMRRTKITCLIFMMETISLSSQTFRNSVLYTILLVRRQ